MSELERGEYVDEINFTQKIRKAIINKQIDGGIPTDPEQIKILLAALKDHDHTTLNDRKNAIDSESTKTNADIANAVKEMVNITMNRNPFARALDGSVPETSPANPVALLPKVDETKLGDHTLVDGEEEIGVIMEDSEKFFSRMGVKLEKTEEE